MCAEYIALPSTVPPACWSAGRWSDEPSAAPALKGFSPARTRSNGPGWEAATASCPSWCPLSCSGWHMAACVATKNTKIKQNVGDMHCPWSPHQRDGQQAGCRKGPLTCTVVPPLSLLWQGWSPEGRHCDSHSCNTPVPFPPEGHLYARLPPWTLRAPGGSQCG